MARPRKHADSAEKQRDYRRRKYIASLTPDLQRWEKAQDAHELIAIHARCGDKIAARLLGETPFSTGVNVLAFLSRNTLRYAHDCALDPASAVNLFEVKSD
jgi:hypothetical protein